jgi:predicted ATPase
MRTIDSRLYLHRITLRRETVPSFDEYPYSLPAVQPLDTVEFTEPVTFLVGENGSGKSTLLEAIAISWGFNPEGGGANFNFETRRAHSDLAKHLRLTRGVKRPRDGYFLRAESFFNVASEIERLDEEPGAAPPITPAYGGVSLHKQSHGESFMALLQNRFRGNGLYILDEPEAALSPNRQLAALQRVHELVQKNSQFIIATHSPIIMAYPKAAIFLLSEGKMTRVPYDETEHFKTTRQFLNHHQLMLREMFAERDA